MDSLHGIKNIQFMVELGFFTRSTRSNMKRTDDDTPFNHKKEGETKNYANPLYQLAPQFIRRDDLTDHMRWMIVYTAYRAQQVEHNYGHQWGTITQLAKDYRVSRTFI